MKFIAIGNANIDITVFVDRIPDQDEASEALAATISAGGSASNFAMALAGLGMDVSIISSVGDDPLGKIYLHTLEARGVDISHIKIAEGRRSGLVVILNVLGENRRMIESPGANEELLPSDIINRRDLLKAADIVHMASVRIPIAETVIKEKEGVSWDPGSRIIMNNREDVWKLLNGVERLFLNLKEAKMLSGEENPERAAHMIAREGPKEVFIKMGARGSLAWIDGEKCFVRAIPVNVVDTTGAGDVFAAAYLAARAKGFPPGKSIRLANAAAALTISRPGTSYGLPVWDEVVAMEFISYGKADNCRNMR